MQRTPRKELYDAFINYDPAQRKFMSPTAFKDKLKKYCEWKGLVFNPHRYDAKSGKPLYYDKDGKPIIDDKSGGTEYFTIGKNRGDSPTAQNDPIGIPANEEKDKLEF